MMAITTTTTTTTALPQQQHRRPNQRTSIFPTRLYDMLENADKCGYSNMISWMPDGKSFRIDTDHHAKEDIIEILKRNHFNQTKFKSFTKQLILYSFQRIKKNHYSHDLLVRGRPDLFHKKSRTDFLEMKTMTKTTTKTKNNNSNLNEIVSPSSTSTTCNQHDAYDSGHAIIGRHSPISPSVELVEQYLPSLPLYIPQQEQANFVDRLGDMYSKNDDNDNNNNVSSSVVSHDNTNDTDSWESSSSSDAGSSSKSDNDNIASSLFHNNHLELLFDEESDYACITDITQEERYYNISNNNISNTNINMLNLTETEMEMLMM